jgi:hypothetical protein
VEVLLEGVEVLWWRVVVVADLKGVGGVSVYVGKRLVWRGGEGEAESGLGTKIDTHETEQ